MTPNKIAPVTNPSADVGQTLAWYIGDTGVLSESMGGYRIRVMHSRGFPYDEIFKTVLYRGFKVYVTNHKADIIIEIKP
jgi:hypothetical protein